MMKALIIESHCTEIEKIYFNLADKPLPQIDQNHEILVKVVSSGINPSDALATIGYFQHAALPRIPGRDFSGVIEEGPADLVGKKIWGTGGAAGISFDGTHAQYLKLPLSAFAEIPENLDPIVAGGLVLPYVTAYYSLVKRAQIKEGESCLVVGALGQVGRAAMSICQWKKAKPVALVRGKDQLKAAIAMGWDAVDSKINGNPSFDVILNSIGNLIWSDCMTTLADFGRIVTIGAREGFREVNLNLFELYRANQEIIGINSVSLDFAENAKLLCELKSGFESAALTGLRKEECEIYSIDEAEQAYKNALIGKSNKRRIIRF